MTTSALASFPELEHVLVRHGYPQGRALSLTRRRLLGGLEAASVEHVVARFLDAQDRPRAFATVVKRLDGPTWREAVVYRDVLSHHGRTISPRLFHAVMLTNDSGLLYLQAVRRALAWPWRELAHASAVLCALAPLHRTAVQWPDAVRSWKYEDELESQARATLQQLEAASRLAAISSVRRSVPAVKRVALALPQLRAQLLRAALGSAPIHGDLHSGNVVLKRCGRLLSPVYLDWGRMRVGSPLEDVSSWLQSLGYWEPEAKRRHDTLLMRYLRARGEPERISRELRESYWIAAASNVLSGALQHHLACATAADSTHDQAQALSKVHDALRIVVRADALAS